MGIEAERAKALKGSAGLETVKKGFCFEPDYDDLFALGWPHIRFLTDVNVEPYKPALYHLMQTEFDLRLKWPRSLALALVRAWGIGRLYDISPGMREIREEAQEALWNIDPLTDKEVTELVQTRMEATPQWVGERSTESFVLMAEALTSPQVIAKAIVGALEGMDQALLNDMLAMPAIVTYQLGYLLLRMPKAEADAIRARLENVLYGTADLHPGSDTRAPRAPCHARSIMLVLQGHEAAHVTTDHDLRWYTHATDPVAVRMRASINRSFTLPDARLVWIGGPRILETRFGGWHKKLSSTDQRWFLEQIAPIKAVEVVPLMLALADDSTVRAHARNWILDHKEFAMPIVDRLASVHNPNAEYAKAFLKSLEE
ncbi:MAG: hypothetical protein H6737_08370 [Alphaproteobacteria bacterium]|nr:hypothetical protein [Alphaproteobacteria bacterium]